jgi:hypothetical protein
MKSFRLIASATAVLIADVLFLHRFVTIDQTSGLFLAVVLCAALIASVFLIYNYCYSERAGEFIYLAQIILYFAFSILFLFRDRIGTVGTVVAAVIYVLALYILFRIFKKRSSNM